MRGARSEELQLARARLAELLARAAKLELDADQVLAGRPAKRLLARGSGLLGRAAVNLGLLALLLAGCYVYASWPTTSHDVDAVRTVLRRTCGSEDMVDRVAAFVHTSTSAQDDC